MKAKLIIISAIIAAVIYSCSEDDRDNDVIPSSDKTVKTKLKLTPGGTGKTEENALKNDSVKILSPSLTIPPKTDDPDAEPVVDPTKPDKPW